MDPQHAKRGAAFLLLIFSCSCALSPQARRDRFLARGDSDLQKHDYARAILDFRNAVQATPRDAEPYYKVGIAAQDEGDLRTAVAFYRKALDQNPKHAGAQLKLAQLMAGASEKVWLKEAETRLNALKDASPRSADVLDPLAAAELKLGETDKAVEDLQQSLGSAPNNLKTSILLAQTKLSQGNSAGAEAILLQACQAAPKAAAPRVVLGQFYLVKGNREKAEASFRQALQIDEGSLPALDQLANLQLAEGRTKEAEQSFKRLATSGNDQFKPAYGMFLFREGRRNDAVVEFERLAHANPKDRQARTQLVEAYLAVNRAADAQRLLSEALQANPKDLDALLERAQTALTAGNFGQAEADVNQVLELKPGSAVAYYVRAKLHNTRGESLLYRQDLGETLRLDSTLLQVRLQLAQSLLSDKQAAAALEILDAAPIYQKQLTPFIVARNWALWSLGDLSGMRKGIDGGLTQEASADLLLQDGLCKLKTGNPAGARASLERSLGMNAGDLRALSALKQSYTALNQPDLALKEIKEYAARAPQSAYAQEFLGAVLLKSGDQAKARAAFEAAKEADPQYVGADFSLAQMDANEGKWDDAASRMRALLSKDGHLVTAHLWLGDIAFSKGDYPAAIDEYQSVVNISPDNAEALNNLAYLVADYKKSPDAGLKMAQRAVELAPDNPNYLDTLGWILYEKGLYTSCIPYLEQAVAKGKNPALKYHLAMAYAKTGASRHAQDTLAVALKSDPKLPEAKLAQAIVAGTN